jgi:putative alpha-1,2-mannosidase
MKSGMAKAVADTKGENQAGFAWDTSVVTGFSHMHDSGTGGVCDSPGPETEKYTQLTFTVSLAGKLSHLRPAILSQ